MIVIGIMLFGLLVCLIIRMFDIFVLFMGFEAHATLKGVNYGEREKGKSKTFG